MIMSILCKMNMHKWETVSEVDDTDDYHDSLDITVTKVHDKCARCGKEQVYRVADKGFATEMVVPGPFNV